MEMKTEMGAWGCQANEVLIQALGLGCKFVLHL